MNPYLKLYGPPVAAVTVVSLLLAGGAAWRHNQHRAAKAEATAVVATVETKVAKAQVGEAAAVVELNTQAEAVIHKHRNRTTKHVERIQAAAAADPAYDPDPDFYRGVCDFALYSGDAVCRGLGLPAPGNSPGGGEGAVRGGGSAEAPAL